jgi:cell division protein FtsI (penicillin-binding protein 3)
MNRRSGMNQRVDWWVMLRQFWRRSRNWQLTVSSARGTDRLHGSAHVELQEKLAEKLGERVMQGRLKFLSILCTLAFSLVCLRLVVLMVFTSADEQKPQTVAAVVQKRGDIVDRNGLVLATNLQTTSLYANPKQIRDPAVTASKLASVLPQVNGDALKKRLSDSKGFVWLVRHLTPQETDAVNRLGLPGVYFRADWRRTYPFGDDAAHLVGLSDVDNLGVAGIEKGMDKQLAAGQTVQLAIDIRLQHVVRDELLKSIQAYNAVGGIGLVMDVRNGEIVSMVSLPDYDPNKSGESGKNAAAAATATTGKGLAKSAAGTLATPARMASGKNALKEAMFNRATLGVYEMGSTFKLFTIASGLESGLFKLSDVVDATQALHFGRFTISDFHAKNRWLSIPEVLMYSSNIGAARIALAVGRERQQQFFQQLGLLAKPKMEIPEIGQPMTPNPWRDINTVTASYGHGMAVSPLQLVSGVSALVNGGVYHPATFLKTDQASATGSQVISAKTSAAMRKLMYAVVTDGTGSRANVAGIPVGGKTGTAEKSVAGGYAGHAVLASFVAAFPMNNPQYATLILVDEPKAEPGRDTPTGGMAAAPVVHNIVRRAATLLNIMPVDEQDPLIQAALNLPNGLSSTPIPDSMPNGTLTPKAELASFHPADDR